MSKIIEEIKRLIEIFKYYSLGPRFRILLLDTIGIGILIIIIILIVTGKLDFYNLFDSATK